MFCFSEELRYLDDFFAAFPQVFCFLGKFDILDGLDFSASLDGRLVCHVCENSHLFPKMLVHCVCKHYFLGETSSIMDALVVVFTKNVVSGGRFCDDVEHVLEVTSAL